MTSSFVTCVLNTILSTFSSNSFLTTSGEADSESEATEFAPELEGFARPRTISAERFFGLQQASTPPWLLEFF
ncbi:hypothetical protein L596_017506 [Steinernema carpocapsae]|uniref:Uncharacterized protein n=1 Tax=Steinernema carpocapsae TaxID=34508 RepID=A0A4U5N262_STECR|nr:hypothetical protein L596_017506 [Steinernema carpocapsae]